MRSAIIAALAAGALAVPLQERDVVVVTDVVYATAYTTVFVDAEPTNAPAVKPTTSARRHYGHRSRKPKSKSSSTSVYVPPVETSVEAEPEPEPTTTQQQEAEPTTTEAPKETYEAPTTPESTYEAPSSTANSGSSGAKPSSYAEFVTFHHNIHRANHSAPDLEWSDSLAATAQKIGESCNYAHDTETDGGGYGQNIAAGVKADNVSAVITELFYNGEVGLYNGMYGQDSPDMSNFHEWGHFSQIVWKSTTEVGCATVDCSASGLSNTGGNVPPYFTVCNYKSPGNYAGQYADNVLKSENHDTCHWDEGM